MFFVSSDVKNKLLLCKTAMTTIGAAILSFSFRVIFYLFIWCYLKKKSFPSSVHRLFAWPSWRWYEEGNRAGGCWPSSHAAWPETLPPKRLPRVEPGRHNHPHVPRQREPDGQPAAVGHPVHPLLLPQPPQFEQPHHHPAAPQGEWCMTT